MHYHGLVQGLIDQASFQLQMHRAKSIVKVSLKLGDALDKDHFLKDLSFFSTGTVLENSHIVVTGSVAGSDVILERLELDDGR